MLSLKRQPAVVALIATTLLFLAGGESQAAFKKVRDTLVLCDFAQNCTLTLTPVASDGAPGLGIFRSSQSGSKPLLRLSYVDPSQKTGKLEISIDGQTLLDVDVSALKAQDDQLDYTGDVVKALDGMKNGQKLQLKFAGKTSTYSLSGLVGGLIYVDEQQSRDGTVEALQVKGSKPAPVPPQLKLIETVEQIPADIRKDFSDEAAVCGGQAPARSAMQAVSRRRLPMASILLACHADRRAPTISLMPSTAATKTRLCRSRYRPFPTMARL